MIKFKKKVLKKNNVVHCKTYRQAEQLVEWALQQEGVTNKLTHTDWSRHGSSSCFYLKESHIMSLDFCEEWNFNILAFEDAVKKPKKDTKSEIYTPLKVTCDTVKGIDFALKCMRFPKPQKKEEYSLEENLKLAANLVKGGDEHAKAIRGIMVWFTVEMGISFMIEWDTYRQGIDCLSSTSQMHTDMKHLKGEELAIRKQENAPNVVYKRGYVANYQTLRRMYKQRRNHKHPDWQIFCDFIEKLPYFDSLIYPEINK